MALPKRELGRTGLQVTTLGYGAMELRHALAISQKSKRETILNKVLDSGINYIDTSIDYGLSEERIGPLYLAPAC
jgi:aryl-alcohol dehydrogenase-like predicted oxidoreductase